MTRFRLAQILQLGIYVCWGIFVLVSFKLIAPFPAMYFAIITIGLTFTARCRACEFNLFSKDVNSAGYPGWGVDPWARPNRHCPKCSHDNGA